MVLTCQDIDSANGLFVPVCPSYCSHPENDDEALGFSSACESCFYESLLWLCTGHSELLHLVHCCALLSRKIVPALRMVIYLLSRVSCV